jgi:serine/threonine-protein kinase
MENTPAIWSPDGERITFGSVREEDQQLQFYWMPADGSVQAERLTPSGGGWRSVNSWSPDGKALVYVENSQSGGIYIGVLSLEDEPQLRPFLQTPFWESAAMFSPDGRWIAHTSDESGRREVYVRPYPGSGEKVQISNEGGEQPVWARDGQELFYRNGNRMMTVPIQLGPTFSAGQPSLIFEGDYEMGGPGFWVNYDVSPDGESFLMIQRATEPPRQINVVLNWFQELERLAPTGN